MIAPIVWNEQSTRSRPTDSRKWRPLMKEQTSWPPIFLLLPFYGEEGKDKLDDINLDFGFTTYLKNEKKIFNVPYLIYLFL